MYQNSSGAYVTLNNGRTYLVYPSEGHMYYDRHTRNPAYYSPSIVKTWDNKCASCSGSRCASCGTQTRDFGLPLAAGGGAALGGLVAGPAGAVLGGALGPTLYGLSTGEPAGDIAGQAALGGLGGGFGYAVGGPIGAGLGGALGGYAGGRIF